MTPERYKKIEDFMLSSMDECAHDSLHVYRVLHNALNIAKHEENVDLDVLVTAALLHDIGRPDQFRDPKLCHAETGAEKAYAFLSANGYDKAFCGHVAECIRTHRFRKNEPPQSIEAKILFDADKLDATGAIGIARTLVYNGQTGRALYATDKNGAPVLRDENGDDSFFREYNFKLRKLYGKFLTKTGQSLAEERKKAAEDFFEALCDEIEKPRTTSDLQNLFTEKNDE